MSSSFFSLFLFFLCDVACITNLACVQSHELWFGSSQPYRSSSSSTTSTYPPHTHPNSSESSRRQAQNGPPSRAFISSATPSDSLAALLLEERALRVRKQNIASFGYAWIKPAGCPKTMLGMREEEAEREEGLAAAAAEMNAAAAAAGMGLDAFGDTTQGQLGLVGDGVDADELERDLDDDIPDADAEGLVEEGEEGFEEDEDVDDDELMERNLDDDIPDAFPDDGDDDGDNDDFDGDGFDDQPDLDDEIPTAEGDEGEEEGFGDSMMGRDLDDDVPDAAEERSQQEEEWQHTDTEAEDDDDDDRPDPFAEHFRIRTPGSGRGLPPQLPSVTRETEAQRRFLQRWGGGGGGGGGRDSDVFDTSGMSLDDDDLRASITSQESIRRPSRFGRRFPRRGGPRDSLD